MVHIRHIVQFSSCERNLGLVSYGLTGHAPWLERYVEFHWEGWTASPVEGRWTACLSGERNMRKRCLGNTKLSYARNMFWRRERWCLSERFEPRWQVTKVWIAKQLCKYLAWPIHCSAGSIANLGKKFLAMFPSRMINWILLSTWAIVSDYRSSYSRLYYVAGSIFFTSISTLVCN